MGATTAFFREPAGDGEGLRWADMPDPPCVVSYGGDDFVRLPDEAGMCAYVNGVPVVGGFQAVEAGDFVRIVRRGREEASFRFAGRPAAAVESGRGRPCAFARVPIEGAAVRCTDCGRLLSAKVAEQIGRCVCGRSLRLDRRAPAPAEELL